MFNIDRIEFQRLAAAAVGALILTTTFVGAAVAPANAFDGIRGPAAAAEAAATDRATA
ncbi:MAG: hypothetical protein ACK4K7_13730 [Allosphingosinicella sp.]|uniref:hypothetical protein n=1 Tax=Allosphingosinicella sp. TaxID=2823234 RepID=UPI00393ACE10